MEVYELSLQAAGVAVTHGLIAVVQQIRLEFVEARQYALQ